MTTRFSSNLKEELNMVNSEVFLKALAQEFKRERDRIEKTQLQVSSDVGIHIGRVEMGSYTINVITLLRLCIYYKITVRELFERIEAEIGPHYGIVVEPKDAQDTLI
jgi:transcriptional regulator with XRE-family HTH domain